MNILDRIARHLFRSNIRGAGAFHRYVCGGRRLEVRSKHGVLFFLQPGEYVDNQVLRTGFYEEEVYEALTSALLPEDVFWDIGANIGLHAVTVATSRRCRSVVAFEANPQLAEVIRREASANSCSVEISDLALDESAGSAKFYLCKGNLGRSSLFNWHAASAAETIDVTTTTGDAFVDGHPGLFPNVVKIDVEGGELRVLRGMKRVLADARLRAIVFEDGPDERSEVKRALGEHGFALQRLVRVSSPKHNLENYLARRE